MYRHVSEAALKVPGRVELDELAFLCALAAQVPSDGQIVEIGAFMGRSTRAMALANPDAKVTAFDSFQPAPWTDRYSSRHYGIPNFCKDAFDRFTDGLPNITSIKGLSPHSARGWNTPIDLFFEDATHANPNLLENLDFWISKLKPGGIVCGHDYGLRFPDVKREVDNLARLWDKPIAIVGTLWALQKPGGRQIDLNKLSITAQHVPTIQTYCENKRSGSSHAAQGIWCGAQFDADRLRMVRFDAPTEMRLEYKLFHPNFGETDWTPSGQDGHLISGGKNRPFTRLAFRACASSLKNHRIFCRVSARQIGNGGHRKSGVSDWVPDGFWVKAPREGPGLCAVSVAILPKAPIDGQVFFKKKTAFNVANWIKAQHAKWGLQCA